jgi:alcohol/geraniol dehydrogenase (NADP+)
MGCEGSEQSMALESVDLGPLGAEDVEVAVEHCGLCHSDLSVLNNEWGISQYPAILGHEVVGRITAVGPNTKGAKVGQRVGVGWFSGSCMHCRQCMSGRHHLCPQVQPTIIGHRGGFATHIRAHWAWVFPLPETLNFAEAGPLLCGGITVFAPLVMYAKSIDRVGIIGIGGLGHMAVKFAAACGFDVTAFTSSESKFEEAKGFGANHAVSTKDSAAIRKLGGRFDLLISTVNVKLDWDAMIGTLAPNGRLHVVGAVVVSLWTSRPTNSVLLESSMADLPARLCQEHVRLWPRMRLTCVERRRSASPRGSHALKVTVGDDLLEHNYPTIHIVGRASHREPRLIDMRWGEEGAPRVTLVGKGVCFDTGGLDLKPREGMLEMKKDMGGATVMLALADALMSAGTPIRLRLLIPAVENSVSGNAYRPLDIVRTRLGKTVEIGNTDAEGRLVLCDALAEADSEKPDLLIDCATLTGAARIALARSSKRFTATTTTWRTDCSRRARRRAIRCGACPSGGRIEGSSRASAPISTTSRKEHSQGRSSARCIWRSSCRRRRDGRTSTSWPRTRRRDPGGPKAAKPQPCVPSTRSSADGIADFACRRLADSVVMPLRLWHSDREL